MFLNTKNYCQCLVLNKCIDIKELKLVKIIKMFFVILSKQIFSTFLLKFVHIRFWQFNLISKAVQKLGNRTLNFPSGIWANLKSVFRNCEKVTTNS
jgi:hypothetical protein